MHIKLDWNSGKPMIETRGICRNFSVGGLLLPVLKDINVIIHHGEFVALVGPSGSGKTTLMNIIGCLDRPTSGMYILDGQDISKLSNSQMGYLRGRKIGFVFQNFNLLPRTSALENVLMPALYSRDGEEHWTQTINRAKKLLEAVGLGTRLNHVPSQLSGGEQQRVAIARALINQPRLLLADEPTGNLDSVTGGEILRLFQMLNRRYGISILLISHDSHVRAFARRMILIEDGSLVREESICENQDKQLADSPDFIKNTYYQDFASIGSREKISNYFLHNLQRIFTRHATLLIGLKRNLLRTALTMLGVIIGVAAVITVIELSAGASKSIQLTVANMGVANVVVYPDNSHRTGVQRRSPVSLTQDDADAIVENVSEVMATAPVVHTRGQVVFGNKNWYVQNIIGTTADYFTIRDWQDMAFGRYFGLQDLDNGSLVCVIGKTLANKLFGEDYPVGQEVRIDGIPFQIIGVLKSKGSSLLGADQDDIIVAPLKTVRARLRGQLIGGDIGVKATDSMRFRSEIPSKGYLPVGVDYILVKTVGHEKLSLAARGINETLRVKYNLSGADNRFNIYDNTEVANAFNRTVELLSTLGISVSAISLLVGGIGIMNIMMVSVIERTKEIGIRMAVGATPLNIRNQFVTESVIICVLGGFAGIMVGRIGSDFLGKYLGWPVEVSLGAAAISVFISVTIGIAFGFYPAWKASRLDPIQSLRFE